MKPSTTTVAALLRAERGGTLPPGAVSSLSSELAVLDAGAHGGPCQVIDVPPDLFAVTAPTLADLTWLAHARVKTVPGAAPGDPEVSTDHAVIVDDWLPATGHTSRSSSSRWSSS